MDIRSDRQKGLSYTELGKKYHMDPRTAKRYAESPEKPEYTLSEPKPRKMDPYKQIVDEWLAEAPYSARRILEKLREMGFDGGYSIVKAYVSSRKMDLNEKATVRFETMPGKQGQMDWGFFEDHLVYEDGKWKIPAHFLAFGPDAAVAHQLPGFPPGVFHDPGVVGAAMIDSLRPEILRQSPGGLLPGDARHLDFNTEALLL